MKKNLTVKKRLVQTAVFLDTVKNRLTDAATSTVPEILSHLGALPKRVLILLLQF